MSLEDGRLRPVELLADHIGEQLSGLVDAPSTPETRRQIASTLVRFLSARLGGIEVDSVERQPDGSLTMRLHVPEWMADALADE